LLNEKQSGGYLYKFYNEMANRDGLIHQDPSNSHPSEICIDQVNAVNFLNNQKFEINEEMLDYLLLE